MLEQQQTIPLLKDEMLLGQELKFKNKLCNLKLGTFFSALPGLGASALSGRLGLTCEISVELLNRINQDGISVFQPLKQRGRSLIQ